MAENEAQIAYLQMEIQKLKAKQQCNLEPPSGVQRRIPGGPRPLIPAKRTIKQ